MLRAACYVRVSTEDQNCGNQLPDLQRYVEFKGWTVAQVYQDSGVSGRKASRPALNRMMADAREKQFDVVVVWKIDRLGRSVKHLHSVLEELRELNIEFASVTQSIDTGTSAGRLLFSVLSAVAEFESSLIGERTAASHSRRRNLGILPGPRRMPVDGAMVKRLRAEGRSWTQVCAETGLKFSTAYRAARRAA